VTRYVEAINRQEVGPRPARKARRAVAQISDTEDAELTRAAATDRDNPTIDERTFARMRPAAEVAPEILRRAKEDEQ
jgi:hypothetical protein